MDPLTLLITILIAPTVANFLQSAISPLFAGMTADKAARGASKARKTRALDRIANHPRAKVGSKIDGLWFNGNGGLVEMPIGACMIVQIGLGFVEVMNAKGQTQNFSVAEWEDMHPLYAKEV